MCHVYTGAESWKFLIFYISDATENITFSDILMFATGTDDVPPGGFDIQPTLEFDMSSQRYPSANTCSCTLRIPTSRLGFGYENFKEDMTFGFLNAVGFGSA